MPRRLDYRSACPLKSLGRPVGWDASNTSSLSASGCKIMDTQRRVGSAENLVCILLAVIGVRTRGTLRQPAE